MKHFEIMKLPRPMFNFEKQHSALDDINREGAKTRQEEMWKTWPDIPANGEKVGGQKIEDKILKTRAELERVQGIEEKDRNSEQDTVRIAINNATWELDWWPPVKNPFESKVWVPRKEADDTRDKINSNDKSA